VSDGSHYVTLLLAEMMLATGLFGTLTAAIILLSCFKRQPVTLFHGLVCSPGWNVRKCSV